jgi:CRISPR-associated endonuclease Cas1
MTTAHRTDAASISPVETRNGMVVLSGHGIRIAVERGHLCLEDGIADERRAARFSRATAFFKRLVIIGHTGFVTLEALRWLHDIGAAFIQIDSDGQLICCSSPPGFDDARLRRAQALALSNGLDLEISRDLIQRKLSGQLQVLQKLRESNSAAEIRALIENLSQPQNIEALRAVEAQGAIIYWKAWQLIEVAFVHKDRGRVPEHWLEFGGRASLNSGNPRKATNPANAMLNYLYAVLESEARVAALSMGLDPGIGLMHADLRSRDSLACDLMESVRPKVDAFLLDFLKGRAFKKTDFFETREGICRVMPAITKQLMTTGPLWAKELGPIVESVALTLFDEHSRRSDWQRKSRHNSMPTLLTQANRSRGRNARPMMLSSADSE